MKPDSNIQNFLSILQDIRLEIEPVELFSEVLIEVLSDSGMSDKNIAEASYISPAALSQWKNSKRLPRINMLNTLAESIQLDPFKHGALLEALNAHRKLQDICDYICQIEKQLLSIEQNPTSMEVHEWFEEHLSVIIRLLSTCELVPLPEKDKALSEKSLRRRVIGLFVADEGSL